MNNEIRNAISEWFGIGFLACVIFLLIIVSVKLLHDKKTTNTTIASQIVIQATPESVEKIKEQIKELPVSDIQAEDIWVSKATGTQFKIVEVTPKYVIYVYATGTLRDYVRVDTVNEFKKEHEFYCRIKIW